MKNKEIYYVIKGNYHWSVQDDEIALSPHSTKKEAIESAESYKEITGGIVKIYSESGSLEDVK